MCVCSQGELRTRVFSAFDLAPSVLLVAVVMVVAGSVHAPLSYKLNFAVAAALCARVFGSHAQLRAAATRGCRSI